jgi:hypothetical protein
MLFAVSVLAAGMHSSNMAVAAEPVEQKGYLLEEEPKEVKEVKAVRKDAKNGDEIAVVGRIGGRKNPWVKGAAAFSIVDASLKSCDQIEGDTCPHPWDYCCEADLPSATLFVTFVDDQGKVVKKDARELLKLKELQTVVIQGKVKRDKTNNVTLLASKVFVRNEK